MSKKNLMLLSAKIALFAILLFISGSVMLSSLLGVSLSTAVEIIEVAYIAHRSGRSVKLAIQGLLGPAALVHIAIDFLIGVGISKAFHSTWAASA
jgi:hypothetical protein